MYFCVHACTCVCVCVSANTCVNLCVRVPPCVSILTDVACPKPCLFSAIITEKATPERDEGVMENQINRNTKEKK